MDAFFASVEQRDNPSLQGKPVVVGGSPDSRGVVAAASYEAREYGIHSAMPCSQAYRKCPQTTFVRPRFDAYRKVSQQIREVFSEYTDIIEPLSLDEAYLDVTTNKVEQISATIIAEEIRSKIYQKTSLTASAGVSYNKFLAKTASDINKPNGIKVILPDEGEAFVATLPIGKFYGIGKVTEEKMKKLGIYKGVDLKGKSLEFLSLHFKNSASYFFNVSRGIDDRAVKGTRGIRKSLSNESTFATDIDDINELHQHLSRLSKEVADDLTAKKLSGKTVNIKVKYDNFQQVTRSNTFNKGLCDYEDIYSVCTHLLKQTEAGKRKVRLIGVGVSLIEHQDSELMQQMELDFGV
jgi:DNA polymerase-4